VAMLRMNGINSPPMSEEGSRAGDCAGAAIFGLHVRVRPIQLRPFSDAGAALR